LCEKKREEVMQRVQGARVLQTVDVPMPQDVMKNLRELAGVDSNLSRKPLLVEFFMLDSGEVVVFLAPLWKESPPVVERVKVKPDAVYQMAVSLFGATGRLTPETRAWRGGEEREVSKEVRQAAHEQFAGLLDEMGVLVQPWGHYLNEDEWNPSELILSPHFLLNLLPLHAAMWKGKPLIEHLPVVYLPSPALAQEIANQRKPLTGEALLLGNPTLDLSGAEGEVKAIAETLATRGIRPHRYVCEQATTDRVDIYGPTATVVHYAGHSLLDREDFLRSGMELYDRRLTALDVTANLELTRAALVYLSSCDSGMAVPGRTDELMALVRVFLYAGSPTVIATLWPLDDGAGRTFAEHFYKFWVKERHPMAVAFQKAMQKTRELCKQKPFYWAPFVLMGAWQASEVTNHEHA
jgi:CHAT domain-containing protein